MKKLNYIKLICISLLICCTSCKGIEETSSNHNTLQNEQSVQTDMKIEGMIESPKALNIKNSYDSLNVATYLTKINDTYFLADCYHDQIIYNDDIESPLTEWNVLTNQVHYAHTIATDGEIIVADDTENNRIMAFQNINGEYIHTQTIENIGMKPHYVQYSKELDAFLVWSSITGEMYFIKSIDNSNEEDIKPLYIEKILKIDELFGVYVRSFTIMDDGIYFVSGHNNQKIIKAVLNETQDAFDIIESYAVSGEIAGMVQLLKIQDYFYITISTDNQENQDYATIIRTKDLSSLKTGEYEDIYNSFDISGGTPYYITEIEGRYFMTHHRTNENIIAFDINDNEIQNVKIIY